MSRATPSATRTRVPTHGRRDHRRPPPRPRPPAESSPLDGRHRPGQAERRAAARPPPKDDLVTTRHTLKVGRRTLRYTATAGRIVLREEVFEDGVFKGHKAKAELGVTSYVARRTQRAPTAPSPSPSTAARARARSGCTSACSARAGSTPVTSATPRRRPTACSTTPRPCSPSPTSSSSTPSRPATRAPSRVASPRTTTGSRPTSRASASSSGCGPRATTVGCHRSSSPASPTARSAPRPSPSTCRRRHGLYVNGIMLISSVLDLATVDFEFRNDRAHVDYLPTYAATAHYHGKHGRKSLKTVLAEAEEYAARDYPWALSRGSRLTAARAGRARRPPRRPDRPVRGVRRPRRPAGRARALLHRAAA